MRRADSSPRWQTNLWATVVAEVLAILAFSAANILIPYYIQQMGITDLKAAGTWTGAYQSAGSITMAIFTPIWGAVGDRHGRKLMLARAMGGTALVLVLMGFCRTPGQLMAMRVLQGCLSGTPAAASALVALNAPKDRLAYSLGLVQTALFVGNSLGPMIGGYVGDAFGYRSCFFFSAVIMLMGFVLVTVMVHEPEAAVAAAQRARTESPLKGFGELLSSRSMLLLISMMLLANLTASITNPVLPLYIQQLVTDQGRIASVAGTVSGVVALAAAVSALVVGRMSDRYGNLQVLLICCAGGAAFFFPQAYAGSVVMLAVMLAIQGLFRGGIAPNISAMVMQRAPQEKAGAALGLSSSAGSIGFALGPMLGAAVFATASIRAVYLVGGVLFTLVTVGIALGGRRQNRRPREIEPAETA